MNEIESRWESLHLFYEIPGISQYSIALIMYLA